MKVNKFYFLWLLGLGLVFTSCDDDEDEPVVVPCDAPRLLVLESFDDSSAVISWDDTETSYTIEYGLQGFEFGTGIRITDTLSRDTIEGLMRYTDYDFYVQTACSGLNSSFTGPVSVLASDPIVGTWAATSSLNPVTAEFREDLTYQVSTSFVDTVITRSGTYSTTLDVPNELFNLVMIEASSDDSTTTFEGIFEVFIGSPNSMTFEIVQTEPMVMGLTPPTTTDGFGSTSEGAFGDDFVQTFLKQ